METNAYFWVILLALVTTFAVESTVGWLNQRARTAEVPVQFRDVIDADRYEASQRYGAEGFRFQTIQSAVMLVVTLAFWLGGGFPWLEGWARHFGQGPVVTGMIGLMALGAGLYLIGLPFQIWDTFVHEARFGFNQTTWSTFVFDQIKALLLGALIGVPLLALLLLLFERVPQAWLWGWVTVTLLSFFVTWIAPVWIMPLFNKFTPLEEGELKTAIFDLARQQDFPIDEVYVIDGSKRSSKANAFFTGFGKTKRIALLDTLVNGQTVPELTAVLAHEIGHYKKKHIVQQMIAGILTTGVLFFLLGWFLRNEGLSNAFGVKVPSVWLGLVFFGLLFQPANWILGIATNAWSRAHEYEADAFAATATGNPAAMITALKKLGRDNLANLSPHPLQVVLHYTHPPLGDRIAALEKMAGPKANETP